MAALRRVPMLTPGDECSGKSAFDPNNCTRLLTLNSTGAEPLKGVDHVCRSIAEATCGRWLDMERTALALNPGEAASLPLGDGRRTVRIGPTDSPWPVPLLNAAHEV